MEEYWTPVLYDGSQYNMDACFGSLYLKKYPYNREKYKKNIFFLIGSKNNTVVIVASQTTYLNCALGIFSTEETIALVKFIKGILKSDFGFKIK